MRIYLAARYGRREELLGYRSRLEAAGHRVTSRWLWEEHDLPIGASPEHGVRFALDDYEDVRSADCLISFTEEPGKAPGGRARGGRHVEFGLALASEARLIVVGWRENVFHYLPDVEFWATFDEALAALEKAASQ
jgi:hypothetical protein